MRLVPYHYECKVCEAYRVAHVALQKLETPEDMEKLSPAEVMAIQWQAYHEYLADALAIGEPPEIAEIYKQRKEVHSRLDQILKNSPQTSLKG